MNRRYTGRYFVTRIATYKEFVDEDGRLWAAKYWFSGNESDISGQIDFSRTHRELYPDIPIQYEGPALLRELKKHL